MGDDAPRRLSDEGQPGGKAAAGGDGIARGRMRFLREEEGCAHGYIISISPARRRIVTASPSATWPEGGSAQVPGQGVTR